MISQRHEIHIPFTLIFQIINEICSAFDNDKPDFKQKSCHYYDWKNEFMAHFKDIDHLGDVMDSVLRSWIRGPVGSIIKFGASLGLWIMCPSGAIS
jgi:hypothetical protein